MTTFTVVSDETSLVIGFQALDPGAVALTYYYLPMHPAHELGLYN